MIIKSIEINNFQCYSGKNKFEFSEGLNVIIGDNGSGKSKLYDAFYWVIYDELFDTSKNKFISTSSLDAIFVSDKAKAECSIGDSVKVSVCTIFEDPQTFETITFVREFETKHIEERKWEYSPQSKLSVYQQERPMSSKKIIVDEGEIKEIKEKILPEKIKPYMWFQGEAVNSLIDFENSETLLNAINNLSDINEFSEIIEIAKIAYESAKNDLEKETRRVAKNDNNAEKSIAEKERLIEELKQIDIEIEQNTFNLEQSENRLNMIIENSEKATKIKEYEIEKKNAYYNFLESESEYKRKLIEINKSLFERKWVLKNSEELVTLYAEKFKNYEKHKLNKENELAVQSNVIKKLQSRLPINVPQPIYVQDMLDKERCLVCNRVAEKESEAWLAIQELLNDANSLNANLQIAKHDFRGEYNLLYQSALEMKGKISGIDNDIIRIYQDIQSFDNQRKGYKADYEGAEKELEQYIEDNGISIENSVSLLDEIKDKQEKIKKSDREIIRLKGVKNTKGERLKEIEFELAKLTKGSISGGFQKKVDILSDFKLIAESTKIRVFDDLVQRLEHEANKHFTNITKESKAPQGIIKLIKGSNGKYYPENQNDKGEKMPQLNASNISLIKLCVIMAIISEKKSSEATKLYTFITDAPMSIFGQNYTIGFCQAASKVYKQSIIMSKDFYENKDLTERLFKEVTNLGNIYTIEPSLKENQRVNRNDLSTIITNIRLKQD